MAAPAAVATAAAAAVATAAVVDIFLDEQLSSCATSWCCFVCVAGLISCLTALMSRRLMASKPAVCLISRLAVCRPSRGTSSKQTRTDMSGRDYN